MSQQMVSLDPGLELWQRVFMVAPLVVVGTREADGDYDLAPKHLALPLGPGGEHYGFVCTPRHRTWVNAVREGEFTVSYPTPGQVVLASLAASPRCEDDVKHSLSALPTVGAEQLDGKLLSNAYLHLECKGTRVIEGFGDYGLIAGRIVAARGYRNALRGSDLDDQDLVRRSPLLAYLAPGRFAEITESRSFPFPEGMKR